MKIMKEYYFDQTAKKEKAKNSKKKKSEKLSKKNSLQPRNKVQKILSKNKDKLNKFFNLESQTLREMNFCEMASKLNTTNFLFKSRMVIYPVDLYLEITRNKLFKEEGK
jgi:hypothetical protein